MEKYCWYLTASVPELYEILAADEKGYPACKHLHLSLLQSHKEILHILQSFPSDKYVPFPGEGGKSPFIGSLDTAS